MANDCNEEAESKGSTTTQIANLRKVSENSGSWDSLVPRVRSFRSNIPKQITNFDGKRSPRCFELIRGYAFKASAWKFTSKVDALPDDVNNLHEDRMVNIMKSPSIRRFGPADSTSNNTKIGLLQCKWKNGLPRHMFTVDDKREIFVADLSKEVPSAVDCVYAFRSTERNMIIGKMEVSTSITIGWDSVESAEEIKSVLSITSDEQMTEDEEVRTSDGSLRKAKGLTRKVADVFRSNHPFERMPSSKFDGPSASFGPNPVERDEERRSAQNLELATIVIKRTSKNRKAADSGGWGLKFLTKLGRAGSSSAASESLEGGRNNDDCSTSMNVLIPDGIHGGPRTSSSLTERWISGGGCDCGGWDLACPLTILSRRSNGSDGFDQCKSVDLYVQGSKRDLPAMKMVRIHEGLYYIRFGSNLSTLQSFAIATAIVHSCNNANRAIV